MKFKEGFGNDGAAPCTRPCGMPLDPSMFVGEEREVQPQFVPPVNLIVLISATLSLPHSSRSHTHRYQDSFGNGAGR